MKNNIRNIFGDNMVNSLESLVSYFAETNMTPEQIADYMGNMRDLTRVAIQITAFSQGNKDLALKINKANQLVKQKRIIAFKQSVKDGTYEEFLSNMSWADKASLSVDMGLSKIGSPSERSLPGFSQIYFDIIQASIDKDLEKEALSQGFNSVDAWRRHQGMPDMDIDIERVTKRHQ